MPEAREIETAALLVHPIRYKIISALLREGPTYINALSDKIGVDRRTLSFHLAQLEQAGVIDSKWQMIESPSESPSRNPRSVGKAARYFNVTWKARGAIATIERTLNELKPRTIAILERKMTKKEKSRMISDLTTQIATELEQNTAQTSNLSQLVRQLSWKLGLILTEIHLYEVTYDSTGNEEVRGIDNVSQLKANTTIAVTATYDVHGTSAELHSRLRLSDRGELAIDYADIERVELSRKDLVNSEIISQKLESLREQAKDVALVIDMILRVILLRFRS